MFITMHENASYHGDEKLSIPHYCLSEKIQKFIEDKKQTQTEYTIGRNRYYMFIGLLNGNRIDVSLKTSI